MHQWTVSPLCEQKAVRGQAINWPSVDVLLFGSSGLNYIDISIKIKKTVFLNECIWDGVCKMPSISFRLQCVKRNRILVALW